MSLPTSVAMNAPQASQLGRPIEDLDTPALLLNVPAMERNLKLMAEFFRDKSCRLRPHFKNHKCPRLARKQLDAGFAVGMTCAKLGEAEVLAAHGFTDLLVANQIVGAAKIQRLIDVARVCDIKVAIDDLQQAQAISQAAHTVGVQVGALIEIDIGMGRCGIAPGQGALQLAQELTKLPGLRFDGLQAYEGHTVYENDLDQRTRNVQIAVEKAVQTRQWLERNGIPVRVITGGASSTYKITGALPGYTEIQSGTYATMDWRYQQLAPEFEIAMTVLARIISKRPGVAVVDIGSKGIGAEFGMPRVKGCPEADIRSLAEEHCTIRSAPDAWKLGQAVELIPSHACTTCNLHRQFILHEQGRVVDLWPIEASGKLA